VTRWWRQPGAWDAVCSTVKAGFSWRITWTFLALGIPGRVFGILLNAGMLVWLLYVVASLFEGSRGHSWCLEYQVGCCFVFLEMRVWAL
jgi:hypothetical protein